jgi:hypothetical protein
MCEFMGMRKGIEVRLGPGDRERLAAVIGSGNSPQKHVWRARIVLLSGDRLGTMAIQRQTGKGKPTIWRWQRRRGLLRQADTTAAQTRRLQRRRRSPGRHQTLPAGDQCQSQTIRLDRPDAIIEKVRRGKQVLESIH